VAPRSYLIIAFALTVLKIAQTAVKRARCAQGEDH
jgi:hypothetical protein